MIQLPEQILPFKSRFVTISGFRMHYIDEGSGPVVLLLHGNPTWCFYYRNVIKELSSNFRVIAPDFLGCGLSDRTPGVHFRAEDRMRHVQEFVQNLGLTRFSMVMHDWGGPIGTGFIVRNQEMIERIVYLNTTLTETEALPRVIKTAATPIIGKFLTMHTKRFLKLTTQFGVSNKLAPEVKNLYFYPYRTRARRQAIWDFVADIPFDSNHPTYYQMLFLAERLPQLSHVPVKIIWGLKDPCFHREMLKKVAAHFPHAEVIEIPEASHLVLEDAPQIAIPAIKEFLSRGRDFAEVPAPEPVVGGEIEGEHTLYKEFSKRVKELPASKAVVVPRWVVDPVTNVNPHYVQVTYDDLDKLINQYQRGLSLLGLAPGDRVLMLVSPGVDFLALAFAVMGRGATPVFIDAGVGLERMFKCIQDVDPHAFIGIPRAHVLRFLRRSLFKKLKFHVCASEWSWPGGKSLSWLKRFSAVPMPRVVLPGTRDSTGRVKDAALIAFTSGATGTPKGVVFTNDMLKAQLDVFRNSLKQEVGSSDLPLLPIFSVYNLALGITSVFPPMNPSAPLTLDPSKIVKIVNDLGITSSFGSPTLWNKIAEYCVRSNTLLPSLKRIFMAGAPVSLGTLEVVKKIAPNGEAYTPYGATEALPLTCVSGSELLSHTTPSATTGERGVFVGKPISGMNLKVIRVIDGQIRSLAEVHELPPLEIGEFIVSGPTISPEYIHRPDANRRGKIVDGEVTWHRMGDLGYRDANGNLYFCGRVVHSFECEKGTFHSVPLEEIFNKHPKVRRSALVAVKNGTEPAIVIEPNPQDWPANNDTREAFAKEIRLIAATDTLTKSIELVLFHQSFPVDPRHNAKIYRDELTAWAEKELKTASQVAA